MVIKIVFVSLSLMCLRPEDHLTEEEGLEEPTMPELQGKSLDVCPLPQGGGLRWLVICSLSQSQKKRAFLLLIFGSL